MKFILVFGPPAVGKMTVWQALERITDLKLFHNHMTIELVAPLFGYGTQSPIWTDLVNNFRIQIFKAFAQTNNEWIIFSYVRDFDDADDRKFTQYICDIFHKQWGEIFFVELEANLEERLRRNITASRLYHKPSKRNTDRSEASLLEYEDIRTNSKPNEIQEKNYIKINNSHMSPEDVAQYIKKTFSL